MRKQPRCESSGRCSSNECTGDLLGGFFLQLRRMRELGDRARRQNPHRLSYFTIIYQAERTRG
jgi:hypothetical protein